MRDYGFTVFHYAIYLEKIEYQSLRAYSYTRQSELYNFWVAVAPTPTWSLEGHPCKIYLKLIRLRDADATFYP
jgi:hypothetical protein